MRRPRPRSGASPGASPIARDDEPDRPRPDLIGFGVAAILQASDGGLRIGEVSALGWSGVNEFAREVTISHSFDRTGVLSETNGWERRTVPISDRLWTALRALPRSSRWVVPQIKADRPLGYDTRSSSPTRLARPGRRSLMRSSSARSRVLLQCATPRSSLTR